MKSLSHVGVRVRTRARARLLAAYVRARTSRYGAF